MLASPASAADYPDLVATVIRGSSVYSASELFDVYSSHLSRPISVETTRDIASRITAKYVADGYSRPSISVDDRMVAAGILSFEIVETRISTIHIDGDVGPYADEIETLGRSLSDDPLLVSETLQSAVRRMQDLAGLSLTASTEREPETPGAYRLRLAAEFNRLSNTLRLSNRGTDEIGRGFVLGQTTLNGLASGRATLGINYATAIDYDEYHGLGVSGLFRPTGRRLGLTAAGFRSRSDPTERGVDRDVRYLRDRLSFTVQRPLLESAGPSVNLTAGFRAEDLEISLSGTLIRDERLRLVEIGPRLITHGDRSRQSALGVMLIQGLDGMGSGLYAIDIPDDPRRADFTLLRLDYVRVARINARWYWRLNALGQQTRYVLPYTERFKIGGDRLGRAFEIAEISGDRGLGARAEVFRTIDLLSRDAGSVSAYFSYDLAGAWKNDTPGRESAATAGIGLSLDGARKSGRLELAKPLTHPDVEGRDDLSLFLEAALHW